MNVLLKNLKKTLISAELVYKNNDFTSSTILYFKATFMAIDYILLVTEGKTPKDHTERFRMLESKYPDLFEFLDKYFQTYRDTYSLTISKQRCDEVIKHVKSIIKRYKIQI